MRKLLPIVAMTFALLMPMLLQAEWSGGIEGGTVLRDGSTASRLRLHASLNERPLSHYVYADWIRSGSNSYEIGYRPRYWFSDQWYTFGDASLRIDDQLQIDNEILLVSGLGYELINTAQRQAWLEAGLGFRSTDYTPESGIGESEEGLGLIRGRASQVLSDLLRLELDGNFTASNSYLESQLEIGVSLRLAQGAIKISQRIRRIEFDEFDTINETDTSVGFTVGF